MKRFLLTLMLVLGAGLALQAQEVMQETVYTKNGSIIKGMVVEQVPDELIKVQTADGGLVVCDMADVVRITKEKVADGSPELKKPVNKALKRGYKGFFDFEAVKLLDIAGMSFITSHGYQFNPYFFLGAGFGVTYFPFEGATMPIFVQARGTFINGPITPYAELELGYSLINVDYPLINFAIGSRFGLTKNLGLNIGIGHTMVCEGATYLTLGIDF